MAAEGVGGAAAQVRHTQCCIVGCGPAGAVLGLMLARAGLDVVVVEKHGDFLRDFRGDDISPSTMELLAELGLGQAFLDLNPRRMPTVEAHSPGRTMVLADLSGLPTRFPFVAVIPQWDFLDFLTAQAARCPGFHLLMNTEVTGLVEEGGTVLGVRHRPYGRPGGAAGEIRATLTVAADGRDSRVRELAGLAVRELPTPIDLLWFRLPRTPADAEETAISIHMAEGRAVGRMNRGDYWQIAYVIPKGSAPAIRQEGIEAFRASVGRIVPDLTDRVDRLGGWDEVSLLSVSTNRLRRWYRPGLLFVGDAAHAMSPIGGTGINFAIQDAVVAANVLTGPIRVGRVSTRDMARVQRRRAWQVRLMQALQSRLTGAVLLALDENPRGVKALARRLGEQVVDLRFFRAVRSRVIAFGFGRVRVAPEHRVAEQAGR